MHTRTHIFKTTFCHLSFVISVSPLQLNFQFPLRSRNILSCGWHFIILSTSEAHPQNLDLHYTRFATWSSFHGRAEVPRSLVDGFDNAKLTLSKLKNLTSNHLPRTSFPSVYLHLLLTVQPPQKSTCSSAPSACWK